MQSSGSHKSLLAHAITAGLASAEKLDRLFGWLLAPMRSLAESLGAGQNPQEKEDQAQDLYHPGADFAELSQRKKKVQQLEQKLESNCCSKPLPTRFK